jgi:phosphotransferase system  glucose/maltose/N-acetylglucosamine-specific IIC component
MVWVGLYVLSIVVSYLLQRWMLCIDPKWWANPFGLMLFFLFIPVFNIFISGYVLIGVWLENRESSRSLLLDFYGIHGEEQDKVLR